MILWRISEFADLIGQGGLVAGGRWHSRGRPIVYTADSNALALLESRVHIEEEWVPRTYQLLEIEAPDSVAVTEWTSSAAITDRAKTAVWGDTWLAGGETALARVPSIIVRQGYNWLINPLHPDAGRIRILSARRYPWDERLFRNG